MSTRLAGLVVALVIGGAACAEVAAQTPGDSLRPLPRPASELMSPGADAGGRVALMASRTRAPAHRPGSGAVSVIATDPPVPGLRPRPRPLAAQRPAHVVEIAAGVALSGSLRPLARPENLQRRSVVAAAGFRAQPVPMAITGRKGSVCGDIGIKGTALPPIAAKLSGCGLEGGVQVTSVDGIAMSVPAIMDCTTASALKTWVEDGVRPAVGRLGGGVSELRVAAHYACRSRNNQQGEKVSEHGRGRAIDISAIVLKNGVAISVLKGWGDAQLGQILKAAHKAACGPFGTVLGPGADAFHRDHLHLDTARYRSGSYCR